MSDLANLYDVVVEQAKLDFAQVSVEYNIVCPEGTTRTQSILGRTDLNAKQRAALYAASQAREDACNYLQLYKLRLQEEAGSGVQMLRLCLDACIRVKREVKWLSCLSQETKS